MNILENGIDSLKKSLFSLNVIEKHEDGLIEYELKDIVIKLHHAVETLVKYMIGQKSEYLIYSRLDDIFKYKFELIINKRNKEVEINTIQFMDAIHRVFVLYEIKVTDQDYKQIKELNNLRNSITHYENTMNVNEVKHLIAMVLKLMIPIFYKEIEHFDDHLKVEGIEAKIYELYEKDEMWLLTESFSILESIFTAQEKDKIRMADLKEKKGEITCNRNKNIKYCVCEICTKDFFVETQPIFNKGSIIGYLGECELCGFIKTKEFFSFKQMFEQNNFYHNLFNKNSLEVFYSKIFVENLYSISDCYGLKSDRFSEFKGVLIKKQEVFNRIIKNVLYISATTISETTNWKNNDLNKIIDNIVGFYRMNNLIRLYLEIFDIEQNKEFWDKDFALYEYESEQDNLIKEAGIKVVKWMSDHEMDVDDIDSQNTISDDLCYEILFGNINRELLGTTSSKFGTIDNISDVDINDVYLISESNVIFHIYRLLVVCSITSEGYFDGEMIKNGSNTLFIAVNVQELNAFRDISTHDIRLSCII